MNKRLYMFLTLTALLNTQPLTDYEKAREDFKAIWKILLDYYELRATPHEINKYRSISDQEDPNLGADLIFLTSERIALHQESCTTKKYEMSEYNALPRFFIKKKANNIAKEIKKEVEDRKKKYNTEFELYHNLMEPNKIIEEAIIIYICNQRTKGILDTFSIEPTENNLIKIIHSFTNTYIDKLAEKLEKLKKNNFNV